MSIFVGEDHLDGDHKWGGRLGYNFTPHLGTEFVFGENKTCHDPGNSPGTLRQYGADMLYFFRPEKKFVPFVAAGFGAFKVDFDNLPDRNTGYFNFGGGVEYSLLSWLGLRADVRDSVAFDRGDNLFEATIGIRLQFGHR
jgi:OOP family OmpA-OmpF porin